TLQRTRPDVRLGAFQVGVDSADGERSATNSALAVETRRCGTYRRACQRRIGKSKRRFAAAPLHENGRIGARPAEKGGQDKARWIAAEFFLYVGLGQPIGINAESSAYHPVAFPRDIPCDANARIE